LRGVLELHSLIRKQQQQSQAVFAREFAAGARAFERDFAQVNLRLIGLGAAALTFAPDGSVIAAERDPVPRGSQAFPRLGGRSIRGKCKNLFGRKLHGDAMDLGLAVRL
jgi:hypothetical protein